jgi:hypothetical protein
VAGTSPGETPPGRLDTGASGFANGSVGSGAFDYDDGFGDTTVDPFAEPLGSWPPGSAEPAALADESVEEDWSSHPAEPDWSATPDTSGQGFYQSLNDPPGGAAPPASQPAAPAGANPLTVDRKLQILELVAGPESGGDYGAMNLDGEFEGRFRNHPATGVWHVGLSYGNIQFTQDSGTLGQLLTAMRDRERSTFDEIFGGTALADELIRVTNAPGPPSRQVPGGRSARVQPVGGTDLWQEPWISRFRRAGQHAPFQSVQNEMGARIYLEPMRLFCHWLGLNTLRAFALCVDRSVQMGSGGARAWIIRAVGPVSTPALQAQALASLGAADLRTFQASIRGLHVDGDFGPMTHAAMVAKLRELGASSPIAVPTLQQMLDSLGRAAAGEPWERRVTHLRTATNVSDDVLELWP